MYKYHLEQRLKEGIILTEKKKKIIIAAAGTYQRDLPGDIEYIAVLPPTRAAADKGLHYQWYTTDDVILHEGNYHIHKDESIILYDSGRRIASITRQNGNYYLTDDSLSPSLRQPEKLLKLSSEAILCQKGE